MISNLDEDFVESIVQKYGTDIRKLNLSNNGRCRQLRSSGIISTA
jgi:hypothetical protein